MRLWFVSMECANIAEAGGVKNVTFSLCKEFASLGHDVTLFIPVFKCNTWDPLTDVCRNIGEATVSISHRKEAVMYTNAVCTQGNFKVILINHPSFAEKEAVYTYTENEQRINPAHKKGEGHTDFLFMDILFQKAVCAYLQLLGKNDQPQIVHCQDASTAVLPAFIAQTKYADIVKTVVTIHNAGPYYHHEFPDLKSAAYYTGLPEELLQLSENRGRIEPFLIAVNSGANLSTVSEVYADELKDPSNLDLTDGLSKIFYEKNVPIKGITNGFDFERYDPRDTEISKLPYEFNPENCDLDGKYKTREYFVNKVVNSNEAFKGITKYGKLEPVTKQDIYISYHGRITGQKGIRVLTATIPEIINKYGTVRFVIAGQGEPKLEEEIISLTRDYPGKITFMNGYNQSVVRMSVAASDFIVLPSYFEPCGLEDFIAQAYGTLPIAHKTGGLNKILDEKTGFLYEENTSDALTDKILDVLYWKNFDPSKILNMISAAAKHVHKEYLWKTVIEKKYLKYFKEILKK